MLSPLHNSNSTLEDQIDDLRESIIHNQSILNDHLTNLHHCVNRIPSSNYLESLLQELNSQVSQVPLNENMAPQGKFDAIIDASNNLIQLVPPDFANELRKNVNDCVKAFK